MKFRGVGALPSSVALWLEQQLEERGVDSAVHGGHILGLLNRRPVDPSADLPPLKGRKKKGSRSTEELDRKAASNCHFELEQTVDLDQLVDELCVKLRESASADEGDKGCLKETTNSGQIFSIDTPLQPGSSVRRFSDLALSNRELQDAVSQWSRGPQTGHRARARRRGYSESSPKVTKRKDNKENVCGAMRGRMRSRSTVKQSSGCPSATNRMRSSAKSLDRNDDEAVVRFVKGEMRGRKHVFVDEREAKLSRTPGRRENKVELLEFDQALPMDVQQLLQSPDDSAFVRQPKINQPLPNFIQCGTNIMSSIWSDTSLERMDEDDVVPAAWEAISSSRWSDARSSILSTAWKLPPFVLEKDIETTSLALTNDNSSSYFSFFGSGSSSTTARGLNHNKNSGFTEVTPGTHVDRKKVQVTHPPPDTEEEDLLTSMKTHFRPIKENCSNTDYKDGSSFAISTNFEQVKYRRSESGSLYLGPDNNKYFEFKRKGDTSAFVPKFKVRQTEKFCQTDDILLADEAESAPEVKKAADEELNAEEGDGLSDGGETAAAADEFFFPGDDRLAEEMVNGSEEDEEEESKPCIQISGCITSWPMSLAIWSNDTLNNNNNSWVYGEEGNKNKILGDGGHSEQYTRLKDELFEEGEELLSDLSSIHLLVDHDRVDDSANQVQGVHHYVPFALKERVPNVPSALKERSPDVPSACKERNPDVLFARKERNPNVPSARKERVPNVPSARKERIPNVPSARKERVPNVPSARKERIPNVPSARKEFNPNVPSARKECNPNAPSAHKERNPNVPSARKERVPNVPSARKERIPNVPSARKERNPTCHCSQGVHS
ncbi:kiaa0232 [Nesidiocoris tenuis]|uniref:Kiaa0232 n=1 Tax=Nesidiocoris tenuis TaxID=355587 RepID=A0ABN7BEM7_9HEMI|nr:kiaa0232 [Nesidiocoris tenuis]